MSRSEREQRKHQSRSENGCKVFLGGLHSKCTERDLHILLSQFGNVVSTNIIRTASGESKGFGFAEFETPQEASASLGTFQFQNKQVEIKPSVKSKHEQQYNRTAQRNQKENIQTANVKESDITPTSMSVKTPTKLSKHSKNFETHQVASKAPLSLQEDEPVIVKVIALQSPRDDGTSSERPSSEDSHNSKTAHPAAAQPKRSRETRLGGGISKFSKEFHPTTGFTPTAETTHVLAHNTHQTVPPHRLDARYHNALEYPYLSFPHDTRGAAEYLKKAPDPIYSNLATRPDLRINFYTFPGRD
jgi:RNA recognition motif-containing protein